MPARFRDEGPAASRVRTGAHGQADLHCPHNLLGDGREEVGRGEGLTHGQCMAQATPGGLHLFLARAGAKFGLALRCWGRGVGIEGPGRLTLHVGQHAGRGCGDDARTGRQSFEKRRQRVPFVGEALLGGAPECPGRQPREPLGRGQGDEPPLGGRVVRLWVAVPRELAAPVVASHRFPERGVRTEAYAFPTSRRGLGMSVSLLVAPGPKRWSAAGTAGARDQGGR